ncbi:uncharacterized protein LOC126904792 isoform X2 [Daktulosphaira vitifoliae]|uniref:uncharacterized protein LOC126904792 isoform X2 n=1 Tax=Daktulosphaira vitifoliae TaxID=58002 RepID=UPI0021AA4EAB|nr:uncharacterized protein LOC126904792 isoform X2 [Daktulosphaira vitifoliae]
MKFFSIIIQSDLKPQSLENRMTKNMSAFQVFLLLISQLLLVLLYNSAVIVSSQQLAWTPIYVGSNSQVDLWTQNAQGCRCNHDLTREDCACCVPRGGCQCGIVAPNRCAQCGLEQYCSSMCNVTLKADLLLARSNSTFGQIKSPALSGPDSCWYTLDPGHDKRVELQVYRLINAGHFNGSSCVSGYLELIDSFGQGTGPRICGQNERLTPPVVMFSDRESALLNFRIEESTSRSQFLAYFSFTSLTNSYGLSFRPKGGRRIDHTTCDWLYQDFSCKKDSCVLASPGFPGIYGSKIYCKYHITTSSVHTKVRLQFLTLSLPLNNCGSHYINVYQGPTSNSPLLTTVCDKSKKEYTFPGPNVLLEFRAGEAIPPYDYSGFVSTIEFIDDESKSSTSTITPVVSLFPIVSVSNEFKYNDSCEVTIKSTDTKSGHFDLRGLQNWKTICTVRFVGKTPEIVQVSLFNYILKNPSCQSYIEVYDGSDTKSKHKIKKLCGPIEKHARDTNGRFLERQMFISKKSEMTLIVRRSMVTTQNEENEFLDGAYSFFNERGTLQPETLCNVNYHGLSSSSIGKLKHPGTEQIFWNVEGQMKCSQNLLPSANQSVNIKIISLNKLSSNLCYTECGDGGCRCVKNLTTVVDQLLITSTNGDILSCICGDFQAEWLPVTIKSWSPINLIYSVSKYSWSSKGFEYSAEYSFKDDTVCGYREINQHTGIIESPIMIKESPLNFYYHQDCTWLLNSNVERHLTIEIGSTQSRPCSAWNISVHEYSEKTDDRAGLELYTFCSREKNSTNTLPWQTNIVVIKLKAMTQTPPQYFIKWRSEIDKIRLSGSTAHTAASNGTHKINSILLNIFFCIFALLIKSY